MPRHLLFSNNMNSNFNDDAKEQIRMRADIAAVIGRYVTLRGHGQTLIGLCPFHKEKTPSFNVNPSRGFYYCFGCGKGGDIFNFVQEIEGVDFREALEMLAEETGVRIEPRRSDGTWTPAAQSPQAAQQQQPSRSGQASSAPSRATKTDLVAIHNEAAMFFYRRVKDTPRAVDYFKSRGLRAETVKEFRLGYAPAGWSELYDYLRGKGIPQSQIIDSGLVISRDGGAVYDRFRDRVIFPLHDLSGRVIAFAGRGLDADAKPKYLNSPETVLYRKSGVLFGMYKALEAAREEERLLIVEGYMDYLALYEAGIRNAAAVSGTALTKEHAYHIKRLANAVTLVFDGDRAGLAAARRAAVELAPFDLDVSILALPGNDDPDSFVRREGGGAFKELLVSARRAADFLIDRATSGADGSLHANSRAIDELIPYALALPNQIVRDDFLAKIPQRLRVDFRRVSDRLKAGERSGQSINNFDGAGGIRPSGGPVLGPLEESFLRILLTSPDLIVHARQHIFPEKLSNPVAADVYSIILETYAQSGDLDSLPEICSNNPGVGRVISMLAVKPALTENILDELVQKMLLLQRKYLLERIDEIGNELRNCPESEKGQLLELQKDYCAQLRELS